MSARALAAVAAVAALTLAGCSNDDGTTNGASSDTPSESAAASPSDSPSDSSSADADESSGSQQAVPGGTVDEPATVETTEALLTWKPVDGSVDDTTTVGDGVTVSLDQEGTGARIGGDHERTVDAPQGRRISDAFVSSGTVVLVLADELEEQPNIAWAIDPASGDKVTLDESATVPPATGGTWEVGGDDARLYYPTFGKAGRYCLASAPLTFDDQQVEWCAPKQHGFRGTKVTPEGTSVLSFDNARPVSCRTESRISDGEATPYEGVEECKAWDGVLVPDGAVWMVLPKESQPEVGKVMARSGDQYYDLGSALAGTLTWCGDATYFARDPLKDGDPAELLRWSPETGLSVAYRSPAGGQAIMTEPRCADGTLTLTSLTEKGDEQVSAVAQ